MEIAIDDIVVMMKDDTFITGRIAGIKFRGDNLETIWIHGVDMGLYMSDGWRMERNITNDDAVQVAQLNALLEDDEDE